MKEAQAVSNRVLAAGGSVDEAYRAVVEYVEEQTKIEQEAGLSSSFSRTVDLFPAITQS